MRIAVAAARSASCWQAEVMSAAPLQVGSLPTKPRLRGHLHQWALVTFFVAGIVLISLANGSRARLAAVIYALTG